MQKASALKNTLRPTPKSASTRDTILAAAVRMVSRDGLAGLTIGELAKAVGMSKSGLFAHFGGKDQLQLNVLQLAADRFIDVVLRPAFTAPRGEPRIREMLKNWLQHLNDDEVFPGSTIMIAASLELDDQPGPLRDFVKKAQTDLVANIAKAAKMAVEEGHFRKDIDVDQFAWSMYSSVLGYLHFKRMLEDPKAETYLRRAFKSLLDYSRPEQTTRTKTSSGPKSSRTPSSSALRASSRGSSSKRKTG